MCVACLNCGQSPPVFILFLPSDREKHLLVFPLFSRIFLTAKRVEQEHVREGGRRPQLRPLNMRGHHLHDDVVAAVLCQITTQPNESEKVLQKVRKSALCANEVDGIHYTNSTIVHSTYSYLNKSAP